MEYQKIIINNIFYYYKLVRKIIYQTFLKLYKQKKEDY